jgi:hypothetical protein
VAVAVATAVFFPVFFLAVFFFDAFVDFALRAVMLMLLFWVNEIFTIYESGFSSPAPALT